MKKIIAIALGVLCLSCLAQAGTLTLVSPNGGESWKLDSIQPITWTAAGISQQVKLVLYRDGVWVGQIADRLDAGAPYSWTVGRTKEGIAAVGGGYTIRVRAQDNTVEDASDAPFSITGATPPVISRPRPLPLPLPHLLSGRLEVSCIDLVPNAEGFGITFCYKNVGDGSLPKASEVPVKPSYRVLVDGIETARGSLFIPAFPAPPRWEQRGYFGGWIKLPSCHFSYHIGRNVEVFINENEVMGMGSHSLRSNLFTLALDHKCDLMCVAYTASLDWTSHWLRLHVKWRGLLPEGRKILVSCRNVESNHWYFRQEVDPWNPDEFEINKKLDFPKGQQSIVLFIEAFIVPLSYSEQVLDIETGNNRITRCEFRYPENHPRSFTYEDWNY